MNKKWAIVLGVLVIASLVLTACPQVTPQVIEKVVKETVVVEVEKPVEVQKVVEVEKIVEVTPTPSPEEEKVTLNWNWGTEIPSLDPALATDTTSIDALRNLYIGLTQLTPDGEVLPMLATEWEVSEDGLEYTFKLRDDAQWVKYKPGTKEIEVMRPVTAQDVVYGTKRTLDPRTGSDYAYVLYVIKGAQALNTADFTALSKEEQQALLDGVGIEAPDDYTVKVTLEYPAPYFLGIASMWVMRPMPQEPIEEYGDRWIEPGFYWSNGPMVMTEWVHDDHMTMEKNPYWWGADEVEIERVYGVMVVEASTAFAMYEANELDVTGPPLEEMDRVKTDPVLSKELYIAPRDCTYYYGFTMDKPPVDNVLVRKALSAAIDRQGLIDNVIKGNQLPANTFAPAMIFGNAAGDPDIAPWALDYELGKEMAKQWLAEAGYPNGEGFPPITLMFNTSEGHAKIAQAIAAMWQDVLGITVKVENQEWKVYLQTIDKDTPVEEMPHVWRLGWCADYPDENNWVHEVFHAEEGNNNPRATPSRFEELTKAAQLEQDPEARKALYKEAEKILCDEEARIAPIYYYTTVTLTKPWVTYRTYGEMSGTSFFQWKIDWEAKKAALGL
ncbi:MAG: peptide ABC transporter substrate-binding protein [Anaerolineae bacterium]|nr:peptide ABC transporter substrate-binding protein [Anaerolineae bacterium]